MNMTVVQRLALAEFLAKHFSGIRQKQLNPEAAGSMEPGERFAARFRGRRVAWVSMPRPAVRARVTDEEALVAWAREHLPQAVETIHRIRPETLKHLQDQVKTYGGWLKDKAAGEVVPVDGITVSEGTSSPRVELEDCAEEVIAAAWRAGEIELDGTLSVPAAPESGTSVSPAPVPVPLAAEWEPFGPPFCDEQGFVSPEAAAAHAVLVQGGFSTPPVEAYRMLRDGGPAAERAGAWLAEHGLPLDDPREGKDTPWPLPDRPGEGAAGAG